MPLQRLADTLPELLRLLRGAGFEAGHDQYLSALDLITCWSSKGGAPDTARIRAAFSGIFSTGPDEQKRFPEVFERWFSGAEPESKRDSGQEEASESVRKPIRWVERVQRKRWLIVLPVLLPLLLAMLIFIQLSKQEPSTTETGGVTAVGQSGPTPTTQKDLAAKSFTPLPRLPETEPRPPGSYYPWWSDLPRHLWLIPSALWLSLILWLLLQRHLVLERLREERDDPLTLDRLKLSSDNIAFFNAPELKPFWRGLRAFRPLRSRRLDARATVRRLLRNGGFFEPVQRNRQQPPAYLALIDQRHRQDHVAAWSREFIAAMRREQLLVTDLHYRGDPRHARSPSDPGGAGRSLCRPGADAVRRGPGALPIRT